MSDWLAVPAVLYFLVGVAIYALTDTRSFASKMESRLWVVPYGVIQRYLFLFVAFLWPLWIVVLSKHDS